MPAPPFLSVVLPVHDGSPALLSAAVASVLALDDDLELLVVDDGSTAPDVQVVLAALPAQDPRIRVLRQDNAGVAAARNHGIRRASGTWLLFVDADDELLPAPAVLERARAVEHDLVVAGAVGVLAGEGEPEAYGFAGYPSVVATERLLDEMLMLYARGRRSTAFLLGVPWAKLVRREVLLAQGLLFDESLVKRSDAEWVLRLLSALRRAAVVDEPLVAYRLDVPGSISRRYRPEILPGFARIAGTLRTLDVTEQRRQVYHLELVKDAINTVFASPAAPRAEVSRARFRAFLLRLDVDQPLLCSGALRGTSLPRVLLYVAIRRRWYAPVVALRLVRHVQQRRGGRARVG